MMPGHAHTGNLEETWEMVVVQLSTNNINTLQSVPLHMNHDSGFIIWITMIFCQNSNRTYT